MGTQRKATAEAIQSERDGIGPLLERDYWAVLLRPRLDPPGLGSLLAARFCDFPPPALARFSRTGPADGPLDVGDDLHIDLRGAGSCAVRVIHRDARSLTLATLAGHPEAGRITFGAYHNDRGDVVLQIRSRARSGSRFLYLEFLFAGDPMQTNTWRDFIQRVAISVGDGIVGAIRAEKRRVDEETGDLLVDRPTFRAVG